VALSGFLRDRAAAFSLSSDVNDSPQIADLGMVLLDAADLAEQLPAEDAGLIAMSEAGLFESMPDNAARVVETPELRRALLRPVSGDPRDAVEVLRAIVAAVESA
jgi:hypothetical protein